MNATFNQARRLLELADEKKITLKGFQTLSNLGFLSDLFEAANANKNLEAVNRNAFRKIIGLEPIEHIVDCDTNPRIPKGPYLKGKGTEHQKMGKIRLEKREDGKLYANGVEVVPYLSPNQQDGNTITGHELRKELEEKQVLNACVGWYLLAYPKLIPDDWNRIYFWATIFRSTEGFGYMLYLCRNGARWDWNCDWLGYNFGSDEPAACLAESV